MDVATALDGWITRGALTYRRGQNLVLVLLAAVAVAAACFGPLYLGQVRQAQLQQTLATAGPGERGIAIRSLDSRDPAPWSQALGPARSHFDAPVSGAEVNVNFSGARYPLQSGVFLRSDLCRHLLISVGRCPSEGGEVAASVGTAAVVGLHVGSVLDAIVSSGGEDFEGGKVMVVGLYEPAPPSDNYWFGHQYASAVGGYVSKEGGFHFTGDTFAASDDVLDQFITRFQTGPQAIEGAALTFEQFVEFPLAVDRVDIADLPLLRRAVAATTTRAIATNSQARSETTLPALLDTVDTAGYDARFVVLSFVGALVLLGAVVIALVIRAAADERQPELALARLRGWSISRTTLLFGRQIGGPVLVGAVPGAVMAWLAAVVAGHTWLGGRAGPQLNWSVFATAVATVAGLLAAVLAIGLRASSQPVQDMLRRVPRRGSARTVGAIEIAVGALAGAGLVVVLSGSGRNAVAALTPALLAVVTGLVFGRVVTAVAGLIGVRTQWNGRLVVGLAGLRLARRFGSRALVAVVCVASALVVSAVAQRQIATHNRNARAAVEAGAPVVLTVDAPRLGALGPAVLAADPSGRYATAVILDRPANGAPILGVQPAAFRQIAGWGWPDDVPSSATMARLEPPRPRPITVTGGVVRVHLQGLQITARSASSKVTPRPTFLRIGLRGPDGSDRSVQFRALPESAPDPVDLTGDVQCSSGCRLAGLSVRHDPGDLRTVEVRAALTLSAGATAGSLKAVDLGAGDDWRAVSASADAAVIGGGDAGLRLDLTPDPQEASLQHLGVPIDQPALLVGAAAPVDRTGRFRTAGLDGQERRYQNVGTLPFLPGTAGPAVVTSLDLSLADTALERANATLFVWLADDDPARERRLVAALVGQQVSVLGRDTVAAHRTALADAAPAWAIQVALAVALLALALAVVALVVLAALDRPGRRRDLLALAAGTVPDDTLRRAAILEHVVPVMLAAGCGIAVGVAGTRLAVGAVPLFLVPASAPPVELRPDWASVTLTAAGLLAVLLAVAATIGMSGVRARRPGPDTQ